MTQLLTRNSYHINRRTGKQGPLAGVTILPPDFDNFVTEQNKRQLLKCKKTINLPTFNVLTLESIKQMSELIAIAVTYYIDIINVQEHRLYYEDIDLKYHEYAFISA